jgi:hypothetical protein
MVSAMDPYSRILDFLDQSHYFLFQEVPQLFSRGEWTLFQAHYFSENVAALGIEPCLWICSQEL